MALGRGGKRTSSLRGFCANPVPIRRYPSSTVTVARFGQADKETVDGSEWGGVRRALGGEKMGRSSFRDDGPIPFFILAASFCDGRRRFIWRFWLADV